MTSVAITFVIGLYGAENDPVNVLDLVFFEKQVIHQQIAIFYEEWMDLNISEQKRDGIHQYHRTEDHPIRSVPLVVTFGHGFNYFVAFCLGKFVVSAKVSDGVGTHTAGTRQEFERGDVFDLIDCRGHQLGTAEVIKIEVASGCQLATHCLFGNPDG